MIEVESGSFAAALAPTQVTTPKTPPRRTKTFGNYGELIEGLAGELQAIDMSAASVDQAANAMLQELEACQAAKLARQGQGREREDQEGQGRQQ